MSIASVLGIPSAPAQPASGAARSSATARGFAAAVEEQTAPALQDPAAAPRPRGPGESTPDDRRDPETAPTAAAGTIAAAPLSPPTALGTGGDLLAAALSSAPAASAESAAPAAQPTPTTPAQPPQPELQEATTAPDGSDVSSALSVAAPATPDVTVTGPAASPRPTPDVDGTRMPLPVASPAAPQGRPQEQSPAPLGAAGTTGETGQPSLIEADPAPEQGRPSAASGSITTGTSAAADARPAGPATSAPTATTTATATPVLLGTTSPVADTGPAPPPFPAPRAELPPQQFTAPLRAVTRLGDGTHTMTLTVSPERLGPVTVRAVIDGTSIQIDLQAPSEAGHEALRAILSDLRRDLAGASSHAVLTLTADDRPTQGAGSAPGHQGSGAASQQGGSPSGGQTGQGRPARDPAQHDAASALPPHHDPSPDHGIDVYA